MRSAYATKVLEKELAQLEKKLKVIIDKCAANPASELAELLKEAREKFDTTEDRLSPSFAAWVAEAAKREKLLIKQMKSTTGAAGDRLWQQRLEIETHINELHSVVYFLKPKAL